MGGGVSGKPEIRSLKERSLCCFHKMIFSSLNFLFIFLPIVLILYFVVPFRIKNIVLLVASIIFYAWGEPIYVILMLLSIIFNYVAGRIFEGLFDKASRKRQLIISVIVNLALLGFFKYAGFLIGIINSIFGADIAWKELPLPIGISFYTFQALSYVIDVYRGKVGVQKNIIDFATYITMFPQLIAGPIVRYDQIKDQLKRRTISLAKAGQGMERLLLGLSKKVILANNLGLLFQTIQAADERSFLTAWLGTAAYTMQIYFDFSGYSDMAIGMGKMLGFEFPENFDYPYLAKSITEFWRKWHMTLSGWFREFVYIPLGGNRRGALRQVLNILIVWALTGLWHGANWNFVIWGLYYGILLIIEKFILIPLCKRLPGAVKHIYTIIIVMIGWTIFSNTDFSVMGIYLKNLFGAGVAGFADSGFLYYLKSNLILIIISVICCAPVIRRLMSRVEKKRPIFNIIFCIVIFIVSIGFLVSGSYNPFLYFRF